MEDSWSIEVIGLSELVRDFKMVEKSFPNIAFKAIRRAGNAFRKEVRQLSDSRTKSIKGNLSKGYRSQVVQRSGSINRFEANVFGGAGKAHHYHLVENGHEGWVSDRSGKLHPIGMVKGRHMMKDTKEAWASGEKLQVFALKAITEALKKGGF